MHVRIGHAIGLQQLGELKFPWAAPVQRNALAFEIANRLCEGIRGHHQIGVVLAPARHNQLGVQARGIGNDGGQITVRCKVGFT